MLVAASRPWHLAPRRTRGRAREGFPDRFLGMRERKVPTWIWKLRKKIRPSRRVAVLSFLRLAGPLHERRRDFAHTIPSASCVCGSNASSMAASIFFLSTQRKGFGTSTTTRRSSDVAIVAPARSTRTDVTVRSARYAPFIQRTIAPGVPCISPRICVRVRTAASERPPQASPAKTFGEQRHLRPDEEQTPPNPGACTRHSRSSDRSLPSKKRASEALGTALGASGPPASAARIAASVLTIERRREVASRARAPARGARASAGGERSGSPRAPGRSREEPRRGPPPGASDVARTRATRTSRAPSAREAPRRQAMDVAAREGRTPPPTSSSRPLAPPQAWAVEHVRATGRGGEVGARLCGGDVTGPRRLGKRPRKTRARPQR